MTERLHLSAREGLSEAVREAVSFILALLVVIPAAVIRLVDWLVMKRIRRRGGLA